MVVSEEGRSYQENDSSASLRESLEQVIEELGLTDEERGFLEIKKVDVELFYGQLSKKKLVEEASNRIAKLRSERTKTEGKLAATNAPVELPTVVAKVFTKDLSPKEQQAHLAGLERLQREGAEASKRRLTEIDQEIAQIEAGIPALEAAAAAWQPDKVYERQYNKMLSRFIADIREGNFKPKEKQPQEKHDSENRFRYAISNLQNHVSPEEWEHIQELFAAYKNNN